MLAGLVCAVIAFVAVEGAARWWVARAKARSGIPALVAPPVLPVEGVARMTEQRPVSDRGAH